MPVQNVDLVGNEGHVPVSIVKSACPKACIQLVVEELILMVWLFPVSLDKIIHQLLSPLLDMLELSQVIAEVDGGHNVVIELSFRLMFSFLFVDVVEKLFVDVVPILSALFTIGIETIQPSPDLLFDKLFYEGLILLIHIFDPRVVS